MAGDAVATDLTYKLSGTYKRDEIENINTQTESEMNVQSGVAMYG